MRLVNPAAGEMHAGDAVLIQGVAGDFHRAAPAPLVAHRRRSSSASSHGAGRGHRRLAAGAAVVDLDGADHPAALLQVLEQVADEIGGGRLAVGAGDGEHFYFVGRMAVMKVGDRIETAEAGLADDDLRDRHAEQLALGDDGDRPARGGVGGMARQVGRAARSILGDRGPGDEQISPPHQPRILAHRADQCDRRCPSGTTKDQTGAADHAKAWDVLFPIAARMSVRRELTAGHLADAKVHGNKPKRANQCDQGYLSDDGGGIWNRRFKI